MVTLNDIIKLTDAGFTVDEIKGMINAEAEAQAAPPEAEKPQTDATDEKINKLADSIDKLGSLILQSNINKSNMPEKDTAQDILANIINPSIYQGGKE